MLALTFTLFSTVNSSGEVDDVVVKVCNILTAAEPELRPSSDVLASGIMDPKQEPLFRTV